MTGIVSNRFRVHNASQFVEQFDEAEATRIYMFIGRVREWPDDASPTAPSDTVQYTRYDIWPEMIAMKRIQASDASHGVPRYDWTSGEVYAEYSSEDGSLYSRDFYAFTDDFHVYKCLSNYGGANSTIKPTGTANTAFDTADGYRWKYMYTVGAAKAIKFLTASYLPVQTLTVDDSSVQWDVQQTAANGAIETFDVISGGSSYLSITGTLQAAASGTATLAASASAVDDTYNNYAIYITSGTGVGQIRQITDYTGSTRVATISPSWSVQPNSGSTYIVAPRLVTTGDGTGVIAYPSVVGGVIKKITIIDPGDNYSYASCTVTGQTGSGANVIPMIGPHAGHGADATQELGGRYVILNAKFTGSESNTVITNNDYRVIGLIADPLLANNSYATSSVYDMTTKLVLTGTSGTFAEDETITGGTSGATALVAHVYSATSMRITDITGTFTTEAITSSGGATATISTITNPLIKPYSGQMLFVEHRTPVSRDPAQSESLNLIIRF